MNDHDDAYAYGGDGDGDDGDFHPDRDDLRKKGPKKPMNQQPRGTYTTIIVNLITRHFENKMDDYESFQDLLDAVNSEEIHLGRLCDDHNRNQPNDEDKIKKEAVADSIRNVQRNYKKHNKHDDTLYFSGLTSPICLAATFWDTYKNEINGKLLTLWKEKHPDGLPQLQPRPQPQQHAAAEAHAGASGSTNWPSKHNEYRKKMGFGAWALIHGMIYQIQNIQDMKKYIETVSGIIELYPCTECCTNARNNSGVQLHLQMLKAMLDDPTPWGPEFITKLKVHAYHIHNAVTMSLSGLDMTVYLPDMMSDEQIEALHDRHWKPSQQATCSRHEHGQQPHHVEEDLYKAIADMAAREGKTEDDILNEIFGNLNDDPMQLGNRLARSFGSKLRIRL